MTWRRTAYRFVKASGPERIEAEWHALDVRLDLILPPPEPEEEKQRDKPGQPKEPDPREKLSSFQPETILRDYYTAEDSEGRRFWLFRQGSYGYETAPRWFLHGLFA
jgi:protein ImuB